VGLELVAAGVAELRLGVAPALALAAQNRLLVALALLGVLLKLRQQQAQSPHAF
jgi:hypothetical protein